MCFFSFFFDSFSSVCYFVLFWIFQLLIHWLFSTSLFKIDCKVCVGVCRCVYVCFYIQVYYVQRIDDGVKLSQAQAKL